MQRTLCYNENILRLTEVGPAYHGFKKVLSGTGVLPCTSLVLPLLLSH